MTAATVCSATRGQHGLQSGDDQVIQHQAGDPAVARFRNFVHQIYSLRTNLCVVFHPVWSRVYTLRLEREWSHDNNSTPRRPPIGALRDRVLQLAERITTPLVPADYLDLIDPLRSGADLRGRIVAIHPETRDAA